MSLQGTETLATSPRSTVPVKPVDSGYASHNSSIPPTPEQKDAQGRVLSQRTNLHRFVPLFKRQRLSIPTNVNRYEKTLEKAVWNRYHDIVERLQDGLKKCMNKKDGKVSQGLVIRIMVLGETYDEAKPYIIICCPKSKIKSVEEFLMQSSIKSIYQPSDPRQISFGIAVSGPPRPKNSSSDFEVHGSRDCSTQFGWNSSSTNIRVIREDSERYATMGGIIKISKTDGEYVLCGLTAGHILDSIDDDDDDDDDNDKEEGMVTDEESESDHDDHTQNTDVPSYFLKTVDAVAKAKLEFQPEWSKVDSITAESRPKEALNRDWALVVDLDSQFQQSNKIQKMNRSSTPQPKRELTLGTGETIAEGSTRAVVMASSILQKDAYSQLGHLSNTGVTALFGADFVSVYTMTLDNDADLPYGSSGSWVIDKDSCEIYGHAVADDSFGDIFVVPIRNIFTDIEKMDGVKAVTLPSDVDVMSHIYMLKDSVRVAPRARSNPTSGDQEARVERESAMEDYNNNDYPDVFKRSPTSLSNEGEFSSPPIAEQTKPEARSKPPVVLSDYSVSQNEETEDQSLRAFIKGHDLQPYAYLDSTRNVYSRSRDLSEYAPSSNSTLSWSSFNTRANPDYSAAANNTTGQLFHIPDIVDQLMKGDSFYPGQNIDSFAPNQGFLPYPIVSGVGEQQQARSEPSVEDHSSNDYFDVHQGHPTPLSDGNEFDDSNHLSPPFTRDKTSPGSPQPSPRRNLNFKLSVPDELECTFDDCRARFHGEYRKSNLARHIQLRHARRDGTYTCEGGCGKIFNRQDALLKHYRRQHTHLASAPLLDDCQVP